MGLRIFVHFDTSLRILVWLVGHTALLVYFAEMASTSTSTTTTTTPTSSTLFSSASADQVSLVQRRTHGRIFCRNPQRVSPFLQAATFRSFYRTYNSLSEECFHFCVWDMGVAKMRAKEARCVDACAANHLAVTK